MVMSYLCFWRGWEYRDIFLLVWGERRGGLGGKMEIREEEEEKEEEEEEK
jgi:hypothetical protein